MIPQPPSKLRLALTPTDFRPLDRVSESLGGARIWLKSDDQTGVGFSGNKIRKLEYLMADALRAKSDVVLTCGGIQSNHCRATAAVCARLGLRCHLVLRGPQGLPESSSCYPADELFPNGYDGNLLLASLFGAAVSVYSPGYYGLHLDDELQRHADEYRRQGLTPYIMPTGGSNGAGLWGYLSAAKELRRDFARHAIAPVAIVCASGSGGTQGGLTLGCHLEGLETEVIGIAVCDSSAYFDKKIRRDVDEWQTMYLSDEHDISPALCISTIDKYIGPGYGRGYPELFECIKWLAALEGVALDPVYTGKAFYGLINEIKEGRFDDASDVVFVHTGGIYGLFPFKAEIT